MIEWSTCAEVEQNPRKVSGAWIFRGTRVPVIALFGNLEAGASIDDFLSWFPGVTKERDVSGLAISLYGFAVFF